MATRKRRARIVLTPLSLQVSERVSRALGDLIAGLPENPRVAEEVALLKAARACLDVLARRAELGAMFDDGTGGNPELEARLKALAAGPVAAPASPEQPPPPPAPPPPDGGGGGFVPGSPFFA